MTGDGNHTSLGGYGLFGGKLERGHEVSGERFNEDQIIPFCHCHPQGC